MDNHAYTEYCFYLGGLNYDQLVDEAELVGADIGNCDNADTIRAAILQQVS